MANQPLAAHKIVSHDEWVEARKQHLIEGKKFTMQRDRLGLARRELPWEAVANEYVFENPKGRRTLAELFDGRRQLVIYRRIRGMRIAVNRPDPPENVRLSIPQTFMG